MKSALCCVVAMFCMARAAYPQAAFEVATIKPADPNYNNMGTPVTVYPGGRLVVHGLPLKTLIAMAFDASYWQLSGGPDWIEKERYDVEAKPAADSGTYSLRHARYGIGDARVRQMLQALLTDRFQLKVKRETKTGAVYLLEKGSKPLLLVSTKYTDEKPVMERPGYSAEVEYTNGHWFLFNTSTAELARFATTYVVHKPVIDRTGLDGAFDYRDADVKTPLEFDFEGTFPVWLRDVGLKLTPSTGPVETLVVEHAEKPSAN